MSAAVSVMHAREQMLLALEGNLDKVVGEWAVYGLSVHVSFGVFVVHAVLLQSQQ
jgi:hypothetical protein